MHAAKSRLVSTLALAGAFTLLSSFVRAADWTLVDIGAIVGGSTDAISINELGQVVGIRLGSGYSAPTRAFLYDNGAVTDLGSLGGGYAYPYAINNAGQIVGLSSTSDRSHHAFLYEKGSMTDLGTFGGSSSYAVGINNTGQIAINVDSRAILYDHGKVIALGSLGGTTTTARAINDAGQVAGYSQTNGARPMDAFIFSQGNMIDAGARIGGDSNYAYGMNNAGQIVGWALVKNNQQAFLYGGAGKPVLGAAGSVAYALNDQGQVVGYASGTGGFLYANGKMIRLSTLPEVVAGGWDSVNPLHINNRGQIVGEAYIGGIAHAILLSPAQTAAPSP